MLAECHNDDALWGYMLRASEEIRLRDPQVRMDPVLYRLFRMGINDWSGENKRMSASIQSMRFATAMGSRLLLRIREGEHQVCSSLMFFIAEGLIGL